MFITQRIEGFTKNFQYFTKIFQFFTMISFRPSESEIGNYVLIKQIGSGAFAEVWEAVNKINKVTVAIKVIQKSSISSPDAQVRFQRELALLKKIEHPFISQFFEDIEDDNYHYLVIEYAQNGNLLEFVNMNGRMSDTQARRYFCQIISALEYLHETLHIAHRDLKAENVLLDRYNNIKLIDFGLSNQFAADSPLLQTACGSPAYAAPEMIKGNPYTKAADIWSAGILLYSIVVGQLPYDDDDIQKLLQKIVYTEVRYPAFVAPPLVDLLKKMLCKNPESRITLDKIKNHYWFSQNEYTNFQFLNNKNDTDSQIDKEIVDEMTSYGLDCGALPQSLILGEHTPIVAVYKEIAREKLIESMRSLKETPSQNGLPTLPFPPSRKVAFTIENGKVVTTRTLSRPNAAQPLPVPKHGDRPRTLQVPTPVALAKRRLSRPVAIRRPIELPSAAPQAHDAPL